MKWVSTFSKYDRRYNENKGYLYDGIEYQPTSLNKILKLANENCNNI